MRKSALIYQQGVFYSPCCRKWQALLLQSFLEICAAGKLNKRYFSAEVCRDLWQFPWWKKQHALFLQCFHKFWLQGNLTCWIILHDSAGNSMVSWVKETSMHCNYRTSSKMASGMLSMRCSSAEIYSVSIGIAAALQNMRCSSVAIAGAYIFPGWGKETGIVITAFHQQRPLTWGCLLVFLAVLCTWT